jgi:Domain of unknown function (DUF4265)
METLSARVVDDGFVLDNIPLFAFGLALGDTVRADEQNGTLTFRAVFNRGGHSTYRVAFRTGATEDDRRVALGELERFGCGFERGPVRMVAIDVPPATDIFAVYAVLERRMAAGEWTFDEMHCAHAVRGKAAAPDSRIQ